MGWVLSACHSLNVAGYAVAALVVLAAAVVWRRKIVRPGCCRVAMRRQRKRFRRGYPLAFLILAGLAMLGGLLYAPNNYDALAYRVPRVLHWLAEGRWHWIHTEFQRLNTRGCGIEWLSAPLILLTKTDRWLFLINAASFLLLPGLVLSVFLRLGVRRRVAWTWMWLLPTGYCYFLQAGGMGNDLFATIFPLAALHFALRAAARQSLSDASLAIVAAALATSAKASNIPLVLPVMVALIPCWRLLAEKSWILALVVLLALPASFAPTAVLNARHCGDWTGARAEVGGWSRGDTALRTANNALYLLIQNCAPPIFPLANKWNRAVAEHMPAGIRARLAGSYAELAAVDWRLGEFQWEVNSALGAGLTLLLAAGFLGGRQRNRQSRGGFFNAVALPRTWVVAASVIALVAYLAGWTMSGIGRIAAPYYPLMVGAVLLLPGCASVIRHRWWRGLAAGVLLLALVLLCITPPRPLWPAETVLGRLSRSGKSSRLVALATETYAVNRLRPDALAPVRAALPADSLVVGMITFDDPETSLWRPFGARVIHHVLPADSGEELRRRGIQYIAVNSQVYEQRFKLPFEQWVAGVDGDLIKTISLTLKASVGARDWQIVALKPLPARAETGSPAAPR